MESLISSCLGGLSDKSSFIKAQVGAIGVSIDIDYNPIGMDMMSPAGFATALNEVLNLKDGGTCIIAICCRSFSAMTLGATSALR